mmetsp:Transcript_6328/g.12321  ORF Transcript_6328/g.12321 Transcript_6328/m.12321 type:complete len:110 (+) Transcript_6328:83-412(+)
MDGVLVAHKLRRLTRATALANSKLTADDKGQCRRPRILGVDLGVNTQKEVENAAVTVQICVLGPIGPVHLRATAISFRASSRSADAASKSRGGWWGQCRGTRWSRIQEG